MKCYVCGCEKESGRRFFPIDLKGTPNRRWKCDQCITEAEKGIRHATRMFIMNGGDSDEREDLS